MSTSTTIPYPPATTTTSSKDLLINERKEENSQHAQEIPKKKGIAILSPLLRNQQQHHRSTNSMESISRHQSLALKLKANKLLPRYCTTLPLKMNYLKMILDGRKTVEGRVNTGLPARTRVNDTILFFSGDVCCLTQVVEKRQFPTFRAMLDHYGITTCLPDFTGDLTAAEKLYRSFPGYAQKERDFGVLGLKLRVMNQEEMESMGCRTAVSNPMNHVPQNHPFSVDGNRRSHSHIGPSIRYHTNHIESCTKISQHHDSKPSPGQRIEKDKDLSESDEVKVSGRKRRCRDDDDDYLDRALHRENDDSRGGSRKRRERSSDIDVEKRRR